MKGKFTNIVKWKKQLSFRKRFLLKKLFCEQKIHIFNALYNSVPVIGQITFLFNQSFSAPLGAFFIHNINLYRRQYHSLIHTSEEKQLRV